MRAAWRVAAVAALGAVLVTGCRGRGAAAEPGAEPAASASTAPAPPAGLSAAAFQAYEAAKQSVVAGDAGGARDRFLEAVAEQPDFTEAWYNLGAATTRLAVASAGAGRDPEALALFRQGLDQKRRARALIDEGKWFIYTPEQREQVISDLRHALEDADAVLGDEPSLLAALKLWAARR